MKITLLDTHITIYSYTITLYRLQQRQHSVHVAARQLKVIRYALCRPQISIYKSVAHYMVHIN